MSQAIYFSGSITGGRDDVVLYGKIVQSLKKYGNVLSEIVADPLIEEKEHQQKLTPKDIYDRDMKWLVPADVVVAEVTMTSLGVGYEIGQAVAMGKRVLCLFRPGSGKRLSPMIQGQHDGSTFCVVHYEEQNMEHVLETFFKECKGT